uniref:uncharacterized protein LOC118518532 n=1 Tax=Halichoerus grypus TaxID=9711 RepID=UPI001659B06C|nr:uncharacterized protein LOC118518532 [Halichoerus grypus]
MKSCLLHEFPSKEKQGYSGTIKLVTYIHGKTVIIELVNLLQEFGVKLLKLTNTSPDGAVLAHPTPPAPGNSGPLTLRAGSDSGVRRRSGAAFPGFPHPVGLCWVWGLTDVVPGAAEPSADSVQKNESTSWEKRQLPAPRLLPPPPITGRLPRAANRTWLFLRAAASPPPGARCTANPLSPSLGFEQGPAGGDMKLGSVLQLGRLAVTSRHRQQLKGSLCLQRPKLGEPCIKPLSVNPRQKTEEMADSSSPGSSSLSPRGRDMWSPPSKPTTRGRTAAAYPHTHE